MSDENEMPGDWDDHAGWEAYYAALPLDDSTFGNATTNPGSFCLDRLGPLIDDFIGKQWTTLWFPGCGFSPLPRLFAHFGFTVYATDISHSAIKFQKCNESIVEPLLAEITAETKPDKSGSLLAEIHDFRTSFGKDKVDVIFNIKSIQGLTATSMQSACRSFFEALRPGGVAFFDTMNVQGEDRDRFEAMLAEAGFYVPLHLLDKWYRQALADTRIPYIFILGNPMIPQWGNDEYPYERGSPEYNRDVQILRDITIEYRSRMQTEYDQEQQSVDETTKYAQVIYSTG